jgi:hypothetical protein
MDGWIKLHRRLSQWEWYQDSQTVHLFIHLLIHANHAEKQWRGIKVERGQVVTGREALSTATGISERAIRTCLNRLKMTSEIKIQATNKYSIITICNYDEYQGSDGENDHQATSKRPAEQKHMQHLETTGEKPEKHGILSNVSNLKSTSKATSKKASEPAEIIEEEETKVVAATSKSTSNRPAIDQQPTTNKNEKKERIKEPKTLCVKSDDVTRTFSDDVVEFVTQYQGYAVNHLGNKAPKVTTTLIKNGCDAIDKLIRLDGHDLNQIRAVLRWAVQDEFWCDQIYSLASLRRAKDGLTKFQKILAACEKSCRQSITGGDVLRAMAQKGGCDGEQQGTGVYQAEIGGSGGYETARYANTEGNDQSPGAMVQNPDAEARRALASW